MADRQAHMGAGVLAAGLLAACVAGEPPVPTPLPPSGPDACGASGMQDLVGRSRSVLAAMTLPMGSRVIEPGMPITKDYSAQRLNLDLDARGRIVRVWCG
ncbi:MAG: I78 family peptidase inhibitor [Tabrizicola sp.]